MLVKEVTQSVILAICSLYIEILLLIVIPASNASQESDFIITKHSHFQIPDTLRADWAGLERQGIISNISGKCR